MKRRNTKNVKIGNISIGSGSEITVQSMLNTPSTAINASVQQAVELEKAGCDIIRLAIPDMDAVQLIPAIKKDVKVIRILILISII